MTREVDKAGLHLIVDEDQEAQFWSWFESPTWEPDTVEAMRLYVDDKTFCVDAGAWSGDTVLLAGSWARGLVAFEPDPVARVALEQPGTQPHSCQRRFGARPSPIGTDRAIWTSAVGKGTHSRV